MVTKEQCILKRVFDRISYGRGDRLAQYVLASYNQGKQYTSDMIFQNDERGLDQGLQGYSPSFIVYSIMGENTEYNPRDPFFVVEGDGIKSIDMYDFERMLTPEDTPKLLNEDVLDELDDSDFFDAFDTFLEKNYPQIYEVFDYDMLDGYSSYDYIKANWDQLAKQIAAQAGQPMNEGRCVKLNESDLREMTNKILKQLKKK